MKNRSCLEDNLHDGLDLDLVGVERFVLPVRLLVWMWSCEIDKDCLPLVEIERVVDRWEMFDVNNTGFKMSNKVRIKRVR